MQRIFYLFLIGILCVSAPMLSHAVPWGVLEEAVDGRSYGVDKLLANEPIYYAVSADVTPQEERTFINGFHLWPKKTLRAIQQLGRANEFKDITDLLQRGVTLIKTDEEHADIYFFIDKNNRLCSKIAMGCFSSTTNQIALVQEFRQQAASVLTHEIGHYYGLGDQYANARHNSSRIYSSKANFIEGSIMNDADTLTCDDYDGLINLIDLRISQNTGQFSKRASDGWWSLCKKTKNFYQEAKTTNRSESFDSVELNDNTQISTEYDKKGNPIKTEYTFFIDSNPFSLFAVNKGDQITRDKQGRISRIESGVSSPMCPFMGKKSVRTFEYVKKDALIQEIHIQCASTKKNYSVPIVKDNDWILFVPVPVAGKIPYWRKEFPLSDNSYNVVIQFDKNHATEFSVSGGDMIPVGNEFEHHGLRLSRPVSKFNYIAEVEGNQTLNYFLTANDFKRQLLGAHILPNHRSVLMEAKTAYDQVVPYAWSFYENFYKPAFGLAKWQQVNRALQKKLSKHK